MSCTAGQTRDELLAKADELVRFMVLARRPHGYVFARRAETDEILESYLRLRDVEITTEAGTLTAAIEFVGQYGGRCRDCADHDGVCPNTGMPCSGRDGATKFVVEALTYGIDHGFISNPLPALRTPPSAAK